MSRFNSRTLIAEFHRSYASVLFERIFRRRYIANLESTLDTERLTYSAAIVHHRIESDRLAFLLEQAPMQNAPEDRRRAACAVTRFAYIHPETYYKFTGWSPSSKDRKVPIGFRFFPPSPTTWVLTFLMPQGRVIYSPNPMPGLEGVS